MAGKLELALDDIVKQNKKGGRGRGGRGGGFRGRGGNKGGRGGVKRLNSPMKSPLKGRAMGGGKWQHDLSANGGGGGGNSAPAGPARLAISNLDFGVNDQDINELFSRCGKILKACVHYDANGRSLGTADVVYRSGKEAHAAVSEYNGRLLDGRPMNVQLVGAPKSANLASRVGGIRGGGGGGGFGNRRRGGRLGAPANGNARGGRGGGGLRRGGRGRGRGGRGAPSAPVSKEDLDKQMEEYRMQTDTA